MWSLDSRRQVTLTTRDHGEFVSKSPEIFSVAKYDSESLDLTKSDFYLSDFPRVRESRNPCNNSLTVQ